MTLTGRMNLLFNIWLWFNIMYFTFSTCTWGNSSLKKIMDLGKMLFPWLGNEPGHHLHPYLNTVTLKIWKCLFCFAFHSIPDFCLTSLLSCYFSPSYLLLLKGLINSHEWQWSKAPKQTSSRRKGMNKWKCNVLARIQWVSTAARAPASFCRNSYKATTLLASVQA